MNFMHAPMCIIITSIYFLILCSLNVSFQISLGSVTNIEEAIEWLSYTYLHVRMSKNPLVRFLCQ